MQFTQSWLGDWLSLDVSVSDLSERLTMAGLEVESIHQQAGETVIELSLTPNRSDCLSVRGLAREVGALYGVTMPPKAMSEPAVTSTRTLSLDTTSSLACPFYMGRTISKVQVKKTPVYIATRLEACGQRLISPIVDILNYVMLDMGQPLHAFDMAKLHGPLGVRFARPGESIQLLDGQTKHLDSDTLVIADAVGPQAIAGVMGGMSSGVTDATVDIFIESAYFSRAVVMGKARRYGLHSEGAYRFERGVDPAGVAAGLARATALILEHGTGEAGPIQSYGALPSNSPAVLLRWQRVSRILGITLEQERICSILTSLGATLSPQGEGCLVHIPSFRHDLTLEIDLIEEIARIYGYNALGQAPGAVAWQVVPPAPRTVSLAALKSLLVARDYQEVISYSFVDPKLQHCLDPAQRPLALANPISPDKSVMRTQLWPGLLEALAYNQNRQQSRVRIFESGLRFVPTEQGLIQEAVLSGLITGPVAAPQWGVPERFVDYYDLAGDVSALAALAGKGADFSIRAALHPALHPGQSAALYCGEMQVGLLGALHPAIQEELGLVGSVFLFECVLDRLQTAELPKAPVLSKFPSVRRDLALLLADSVSAAQLLAVIRESMGVLLQDVFIFDVYRGKGIPEGFKSVAVGLILQDKAITLVEADVEARMQALLLTLAQDLHATLRT